MNISGIKNNYCVKPNNNKQNTQAFGSVILRFPSETREIALNSTNLWNHGFINKVINTGVMAAGAVQGLAKQHLGDNIVSKIALNEAVDGIRESRNEILINSFSLLSSTFSRLTANIEGLNELRLVHRPTNSRSPLQIPEIAFQHFQGAQLKKETTHSYPISNYISLDLSGDAIVRCARNIAMDCTELIPELGQLSKQGKSIKIEGPTWKEKYEASKALAGTRAHIALGVAEAQLKYGWQGAREIAGNFFGKG